MEGRFRGGIGLAILRKTGNDGEQTTQREEETEGKPVCGSKRPALADARTADLCIHSSWRIGRAL